MIGTRPPATRPCLARLRRWDPRRPQLGLGGYPAMTHVFNFNPDAPRRSMRTQRSSKAPTAFCSRSTARSSPTTTRRCTPSPRATSSPATSSASTTTRSSSTSATSPRGSFRPASCRSASQSTRATKCELGEEVDALVLTKEDQDGRLILSKKRARFEKAWRRIEAAAESGEPVQGSVIEVVKGGLIIDLGVRGFLPASLVDIRRVPNLDEYMGRRSSARSSSSTAAATTSCCHAGPCSRSSARRTASGSSTGCSPARSWRARSPTSSTSARSSTSTGSTA